MSHAVILQSRLKAITLGGRGVVNVNPEVGSVFQDLTTSLVALVVVIVM